MAKELPYFKFFVSEWSDGDITLEDFETQGLFINLCAYYWSNECFITLSKSKKKFRNCSESCFNYLIDSGIIKINEDVITINFLDEQKEDRNAKSLINKKNGSKGGRPKKQTETEEKPSGFISLTEEEAKQKALREEERREEKRIKEDKEKKFNIFWDLYNKKRGKEKCFKKFMSLSEKDIEDLKSKIKPYVDSTPDPQFRKDPLSWLNGKHWQDEVIEKPKRPEELGKGKGGVSLYE
jgi:hypothetical protein